ncbi:hypothetical protein ACJ73_03898 [Blastomyces percursus]|uniref:Calcineurin-like phosphoesterase domain-containing protein n=1 Tax=Blastomyces percursus TaxID=1658174 RepID=A0A1J9R8C0_9EURO|nr:hypothetical protein ACJ73_03898 [Blastomyces percursus]
MDEMQVQILSDLHSEAPAAYDVYSISPKAPILAVLSDAGYIKDKGYFEFLRKQLANFRILFLVLGNHEPYHSDWAETKSKVKRFKDDMEDSFRKGEVSGKFVLLDQTRYDISPIVTILGCTLFSHVVPDQIDTVNFGLKRFLSHKQLVDRGAPTSTLFGSKMAKYRVNTVHANSNLSPGFMTDLSNESCWRNRNVKLWAFGHTHFNCDFEDTETGKRVVVNQRGYYFAQAKDYEEEKVVRV